MWLNRYAIFSRNNIGLGNYGIALPGQDSTISSVTPDDGWDSSSKPELGNAFQNLVRDAGGYQQLRGVGGAHLKIFINGRNSPHGLKIESQSRHVCSKPIADMAVAVSRKIRVAFVSSRWSGIRWARTDWSVDAFWLPCPCMMHKSENLKCIFTKLITISNQTGLSICPQSGKPCEGHFC